MPQTDTPAALTQEPGDTLEICLRQGDFKFTQRLTSSCLQAAHDPAKMVGFVAAGMYSTLIYGDDK